MIGVIFYEHYIILFPNIYPSLLSTGLHIHGLAHAASSYHRVLEENRKLYNQVQDLKGNDCVLCSIVISLSLSYFLPLRLN